MCSGSFKRRRKRTFKNGKKRGFFHKPKTCLGMCDITLKLALIQSLVFLLKIYKIKKLGNVASAVISPILPKRCEQICIFKLHEHFTCSGVLGQHNSTAKVSIIVNKKLSGFLVDSIKTMNCGSMTLNLYLHVR